MVEDDVGEKEGFAEGVNVGALLGMREGVVVGVAEGTAAIKSVIHQLQSRFTLPEQ